MADKSIRKYIVINGKKYRYIGNYEKLGIEKVQAKFEKLKRVAVYYDDYVVPYLGAFDENEKLKYGIYYDFENENLVYAYNGKYKYTLKDVFEEEKEESNGFLSLSSDVLNDIKNIKTDESIKEKRKAIKKSSIQRANDYLKFEINENDDIMVKLIKERINDSLITMNDVYEKYENEGYNLYYGLLNRNTITLKSLEKWCNITNSEFEFIIKAKEKK